MTATATDRVEVAAAAHNAAMRALRVHDELREQVRRGVIVTKRVLDDGRVKVDERRLDPLDRELRLSLMDEGRPDVLRRVAAARDELQAAKVERARDELPGRVAAHADAAARVVEARASVEHAYSLLAASVWQLNDAALAESNAARDATALVAHAQPDDERRQLVQRDARSELPVALDDDGRPDEWRQRPTVGVFGGVADHDRPDRLRFYEQLGRIATDQTQARTWLPALTLARIEQAAVPPPAPDTTDEVAS